MENKTDNALLRREKIRLRSALGSAQRAQKSAGIAAALLDCEAWKNAENLLIYVSFGSEVSTIGLMDAALSQGKRLYCPKVEENGMEFYRIRSRRELTAGFRGILEPSGGSESFAAALLAGKTDGGAKKPEREWTLLVAPGTVFDRDGHRIGYGGGYYDRYLGRLGDDRPCCIGLCFACQLTDHIDAHEHDAAMDIVLFA